MTHRRARLSTVFAAALLLAANAAAQTLTSPKQHFGFNIGDDYQLATYDQFQAYWQKLDKESNRMQVVEIGKTEEGRPHLAAIITAPENFAKLDRYKQISQQLHQRPRPDRRAGAGAREGGEVGRLDRRRPARHRGGRRAPAARNRLHPGQPHRRGDYPDPARRDRGRGPRESGRHADGVEVLHAERRPDSSGAPAARASTTSTPGTTTTATSTWRTPESPRT